MKTCSCHAYCNSNTLVCVEMHLTNGNCVMIYPDRLSDRCTFATKTEMHRYVLRLAKQNNFSVKEISRQFGGVLYDIQFVDITGGYPQFERYFYRP